MSSPGAPLDVAAVWSRRWALLAVAMAATTLTTAVVHVATASGGGGDVVVPLLVALVVGTLLGVAAIVVVERFDTTIREPSDLAKVTSAPNLAVVLRHPLGSSRPDDVTMLLDPNSIEAEGYRSLRTSLEFVLGHPPEPQAHASPSLDEPAVVGQPDEAPAVARAAHTDRVPGKIVLVTSARPAEGKSSVAANLAAAAAMAGRRVVLIDGDLRKPQVHRLFRLKNEVGLSTMLSGEAQGFSAVQRLEGSRRLVVLSGGPPPPDPAEMLAHARLGLVLRSMAVQADLLVVDAPPLLAVTDPTVIAQHCDGVVMVATAEVSDRREWVEALRRLAVVGADVVGTVLLQPDDRVRAVTTYRYAPSAVPKNWWVADDAPSVPATDTDSPDADSPEIASPDAAPPDVAAEPGTVDDPHTPDAWPTTSARATIPPTDTHAEPVDAEAVADADTHAEPVDADASAGAWGDDEVSVALFAVDPSKPLGRFAIESDADADADDASNAGPSAARVDAWKWPIDPTGPTDRPALRADDDTDDPDDDTDDATDDDDDADDDVSDGWPVRLRADAADPSVGPTSANG